MNHNYEQEIEDILTATPKLSGNLITVREIIIYGAGTIGRRVLTWLRGRGVTVSCFLDERGGHGLTSDGVPVLQPNDTTVNKKVKVIVALFNHRTDVAAVKMLLWQLGFSDIVLYTEVYLNFSAELPARYWLGPIDIYQKNLSQLADVLALLQDEISRDLFKSWLQFRVSGDIAVMPEPDIKNIYFPTDIPAVRRPNKIIDCGAFDGDTLMSVYEKFGTIDSILAFEPDGANFSRLTTRETDEKKLSHNTTFIPCGVWSRTGQFKFFSENYLDSRISADGNVLVQCVALDECFRGYQPDFIKMDIEGAEPKALRGCRLMIGLHKPDLAISIYHHPEHLWEIPLFIKSLVPDYKFYLRTHGYNGYDTVFYAYYEGGRKKLTM